MTFVDMPFVTSEFTTYSRSSDFSESSGGTMQLESFT